MTTWFRVALVACACLVSAARLRGAEVPKGAAPAPPARKVPGITVKDAFPKGCVSCHVNMPQAGVDARLSKAMRRWMEKVDGKLLAKAQAAMPPGVSLKGKHPPALKALENIPAACMPCHRLSAKTAPPFGLMLHVIHLTGAAENPFMTVYQGECTHCHKLNARTGAWVMPSGPEE